MLVNPAGLAKLPSLKRPKASVWSDERVARWCDAVARMEASDAIGPALLALEAATVKQRIKIPA